jgi:hypothetical protein
MTLHMTHLYGSWRKPVLARFSAQRSWTRIIPPFDTNVLKERARVCGKTSGTGVDCVVGIAATPCQRRPRPCFVHGFCYISHRVFEYGVHQVFLAASFLFASVDGSGGDSSLTAQRMITTLNLVRSLHRRRAAFSSSARKDAERARVRLLITRAYI